MKFKMHGHTGRYQHMHSLDTVQLYQRAQGCALALQQAASWEKVPTLAGGVEVHLAHTALYSTADTRKPTHLVSSGLSSLNWPLITSAMLASAWATTREHTPGAEALMCVVVGGTGTQARASQEYARVDRVQPLTAAYCPSYGEGRRWRGTVQYKNE